METLISNLNGSATRYETLNGRSYLVAPLTLIVPGVLPGSKGRLYYPPEEVALNEGIWNGFPLVVNHPEKDGRPVSARHPSVLQEYGIGFVFNDHVNSLGERKAEGWFDVERTEEYDRRLKAEHRMLPRLKAGKPIELSTGLYTDNHPTRNGKCPKTGREYDAVARNYRPDHVAILPDSVGACSLRDGCGVLNGNRCEICERQFFPTNDETTNVSPTPEEQTVNKEQLIGWLTTNCDCWKSPEDRKTLNEFSDAKLKQLKDAAEKANETAKKLTEAEAVVTNANAEIAKLKATPAAVPDKTSTTTTTNTDTTKSPPTVEKKMTFKEMLAAATPEEQAVWNTAVQINERERRKLIEVLVANVAGDDAKNKARTVYGKMTTPDLVALAEAAPKPTQTNNSNGLPYFPALDANNSIYIDGGVNNSKPTVNGSTDDILDLPSMDWGK